MTNIKEKMTLKITKTILFAGIVGMMILPFSMIDFAEAETNSDGIGELTAYEEWVISTLPVYYTDAQVVESTEKLRSFIDTLDGYELFILKQVIDIAESEKQIDNAKEQDESEETIKGLEKEKNALYFKLEEYGVTTKDRFDANPEYWKSKTIESKKEYESPKIKSVSMNNGNPNISYVHQTDLALKRTSLLTVPIFGHGHATIPFTVVEYGWNNGKTTASWGFITNPTGGTVTMESSVCLDQPTHHSSVDFDMRSKGNTKNVLGQVQYNYDRTFNDINHSDVDTCKTYIKSYSVPSTHSAKFYTKISRISLD